MINNFKRLLNEEEYRVFFKKALKKFGVKSPKDFKSNKEKVAFFDYVEKNWTEED